MYKRQLEESAPGFLKSAGTFPKWDSDVYPSFACDQTLNGSPAYQHHLSEGWIAEDALASLAVHPTQIYESVAGLALFAFSFWLLNNRTFRGQVLVTVGALYGLWRFFIEYLRDDPERGFAFGFSTSQLISLALIPVCIIAYIHLKKRAEEHGDIELPPWALAEAAAAAGAAPTDDGRPAKYKPKKKKKKRKK